MNNIITNPTAQKLMMSFMQFHKAEWHQRSIAGCKPSEIRVLFCIKKGAQADGADMKVSEISKRLQVTPPTVTQLIKGLEANGFIERNIDPIDRRAVGIKLTEKGEVVTQRAAEAFASSINGLIAYLGVEQSNQLAELMSKASHYYNEQSHLHGDDEL